MQPKSLMGIFSLPLYTQQMLGRERNVSVDTNAALETEAAIKKTILHACCEHEVSTLNINWLLLRSQQSVHSSWHGLHMNLEGNNMC